MVPLTSAPPRSAVLTLSPSKTARTRPNSTAEPTSPSSVSTSIDSPAATRYCFPPVSITAYIDFLKLEFPRNLRSFNILQRRTRAQRPALQIWSAALVWNLSPSKGFDDRTELITLFGRVKTIVLGEPRNQAIQSLIRELVRCRVIPIVLPFVSNQV